MSCDFRVKYPFIALHQICVRLDSLSFTVHSVYRFWTHSRLKSELNMKIKFVVCIQHIKCRFQFTRHSNNGNGAAEKEHGERSDTGQTYETTFAERKKASTSNLFCWGLCMFYVVVFLLLTLLLYCTQPTVATSNIRKSESKYVSLKSKPKFPALSTPLLLFFYLCHCLSCHNIISLTKMKQNRMKRTETSELCSSLSSSFFTQCIFFVFRAKDTEREPICSHNINIDFIFIHLLVL